MRSGGGQIFNPQQRGGRRAVFWLTMLAVAVFAVAVPTVVGVAIGDQDREGPGGVELTKAEASGRQVFNRNCTQCHTLAAANGVGTVGPNLDVLRPPKALVLNAIAKGRANGRGQMPALLVEGQEAEDVAAFVAKTAGR
jgi:mono/diheme cytochrome c family protein